jgi:hypothetical protein
LAAAVLVGASVLVLVRCDAPSAGPVLAALPVLPPDGQGYVVSAYSNGNGWHVLDPTSGRYKPTVFQVNAVSPDLRYALVADHVDRAGVLDTTSGKAIRWFGSTFTVPLGWSPDGRWIALANAIRHNCRTECDFTDEVRFVDVTTGRQRDVSTDRQLLNDFGPPRQWTADGRILVGTFLVGRGGTVEPVPIDVASGAPVIGTDKTIVVQSDTRDSNEFPHGGVTVVQVDLSTGNRAAGDRLDRRRIDTTKLVGWLSTTEFVVQQGDTALVTTRLDTGATRHLTDLPEPAHVLRLQRRAPAAGGAVVF